MLAKTMEKSCLNISERTMLFNGDPIIAKKFVHPKHFFRGNFM